MSTVTELEWHWDFICGSISGFANCLSGYIFDTLKVKVQMNPEMTMMGYLKQMSAEGRIGQLFNGIYYPLITIPLVNAVVFGSYEFYKKISGKQHLSLLDGIQNGAFAGLINTFVVSPVELIKCRMQLDSNTFQSSHECMHQIIKRDGLRGLFVGTFATAAREIPAYSAQFAAYQLLKDALTSSPEDVLTFGEGCLVGAIAGINCWIFSYPQDIIKTKIQVSQVGTYKNHRLISDGGFVECGKEIYAKSGVRGFWFGIQPCLARAVIANSFGIAAYERAKHYFKKQDII